MGISDATEDQAGRRTELLLPNAGIMVRDRRSHRIRGWQIEPCLENRSSPEIENRSLTSTPSYGVGTRPSPEIDILLQQSPERRDLVESCAAHVEGGHQVAVAAEP